jgi:monoterpene epsilon-lactone hydrolase
MADPEITALREIFAQRPKVTDIAERRKGMDANVRVFPTASDITVEAVTANGVPAEWNSAPGADTRRAVLYFHGGGYVFGSLDSHRHMVSEIARDFGGRTLALHYRLAPEHPFPAPVEDAVAAYRYLLAQGIAPNNIALAGDSAGGGLVVAALVAIRDAGLAQPSCGWCISPWVDMEAIGGSMVSNAGRDPTVQKETIQDIAKLYLNGADPRSPLAAPMYADLHGIAPLYIQVGAVETLLDDSIRLAGIAGAADVPVTLEVWPEMVHVWHLFHPRLAAGRRAIAAGTRHLRSAMDGKRT